MNKRGSSLLVTRGKDLRHNMNGNEGHLSISNLYFSS
jgi:hypothetical protein